MASSTQLTLPEALSQVQQLIQHGTSESRRDARELCLRILAVAPTNGNALYFLGVIDFNDKDYPAAVDQFQSAIEANPQVASPHFFRGCALLELQRNAEAESALREAVALQPKQPDFLLNLARALIEQHKFSEARQICDTLLGLDSENARAHVFRATALHALGRTSEAVSACRQAIEIDSTDAKSHHNLAIFLKDLGLVQEAETALQTALKVQPDFEPAYLFLAGCLRGQGRTEETMTRIEALKNLNPAFPDLDIQLAEARELLAIEARAQTVARDLKPVFILAPVARCGSTLLQRLFNSSDQMIMFGENEDVARRLPACVDFALSKAFLKDDLSAAGNLEKFITEDWVAGLFPGRGGAYLDLALRNFYDAIGHYQITAAKLDRAWGIKEPNASQLGMLRSLLPNARFICVYRNLFDVARSYKARGWLAKPFDSIKLAHDWQEEIQRMFSCGSRNVLMLKYENLVANPDAELARIEEFASISGIDRNLMKIKVNAGESDRHGRSVSVYRAPQELTQDEHDILVKYAYGMLRHLGYL